MDCLLGPILPDDKKRKDVSGFRMVGEGLVGGVIAHHRAVECIVVLVRSQQLCLLEEYGLPGLPDAAVTVFQGTGGTEGGGNPPGGSLHSGANGLLPENGAVKPLGGVFSGVGAHTIHLVFVQMFAIIIK